MATKIAINGFGRIGRAVARIIMKRDDMELVAINDLAPAKSLAHLFKYDTSMGSYCGTVEGKDESIVIDGKEIKVLAIKNPAELPWSDMGIEVVVESTGIFRKKETEKGGYGDHLKAGAKKVVLTVPAKDQIDATCVMGVNDDILSADTLCVSNASCTTNCLAPMSKVLHESFGIKRGLMTTVHGYTNDQNVCDMIHSDLRRARAAAMNIIPTTTGAAAAVGKVIPDLNGKLDGGALRVPVITGSCVDLSVEFEKDASAEDINKAIKDAAEGPLKGILAYCDEPIVSSDIIGNPHSSIFDSLCTMSMGNFAKVISWYDNEWGYSQRTCDMIAKIAAL